MKEIYKRLITSAALYAVLALLFASRLLTPFVFDAAILVLAGFACYEVMRVKKLGSKGVRDYYIYPYIVIAYGVFLLGILLDTPFAWWLHIILQLLIAGTALLYVYIMSLTDKDLIKECKLRKKDVRREALRVMRELFFVMLYPALMVLAFIPINHLDRFDQAMNAPVGLFFLLLIFAISAASDTAAYAFGRVLKGPKLWVRISPGKTWSGAVAAVFGGVLGALLVLWPMSASTSLQEFLTANVGYNFNVQFWIICVGFFGGIITHCGDLFASYIKRKNEAKDFGTLLPGHGGIMDRIDGIIWNAVFIFFVSMLVVFIV